MRPLTKFSPVPYPRFPHLFFSPRGHSSNPSLELRALSSESPQKMFSSCKPSRLFSPSVARLKSEPLLSWGELHRLAAALFPLHASMCHAGLLFSLGLGMKEKGAELTLIHRGHAVCERGKGLLLPLRLQGPFPYPRHPEQCLAQIWHSKEFFFFNWMILLVLALILTLDTVIISIWQMREQRPKELK